MYDMIRTIQPVGQGGFYTEIFSRDTGNGQRKEFCYVYDCGASNRGEPKNSISSALPLGMPIEILFIFHFDSDHVNGIKELKRNHPIRCIVMPQFDDYK